MNRIRTDVHTLSDPVGQRSLHVFLAFSLFFCSGGPPPAMCSLFQRQPWLKKKKSQRSLCSPASVAVNIKTS